MTVLQLRFVATACRHAGQPGDRPRKHWEWGPAPRGLTLEGCFDQVADEFAVYRLPGQTGHHRFHHVSHVLER